MSAHTIIAMPSVVASLTGHSAYEIGPRHVWLLDHNGRRILRGKRVSRALRSKLPADFGPDMKAGAFGMADAYNAASA